MAAGRDRQQPIAEIRNDSDGTLDEVVAGEPRFVHLEQMDRDAWWLRIDLKDGRAIVVNLWTARRTTRARRRILARAEWD